jgi:Antibiotic biosynthesis monooxygenase
MFSSIRRYTVEGCSVEELTRRVKEGFVPLVRRMKGFRGYYLVSGGQNVLVAMSVFETAEQAFASNEAAAAWVRNNLLESKTGAPEIIMGDVLMSEVK